MSLNCHHSLRFQQGRGIGSLFGGLLRFLKPMASMGFRAGKKLLESDLAKKVGSAALDVGKEAAKNIAVDILEGRAFKDSAKNQLDEAKKVISSAIKGGGSRKRKNRRRTVVSDCSKKKKYNLLQ